MLRPTLLLALLLFQADAPKPVPVYEEPKHHVVFENQYARVLDVHIPHGTATQFHIHPNPLVGVTIQDSPSWEQKFGKIDRGPKTKPDAPGAIFDNWDRKRPYTHRVGNVGKVDIHYLAAEVLSSADDKFPALPTSPNLKLIKDGPYARFYRIKLAPGESTEPHTHAAPGLTVQVSDAAPDESGDHAKDRGGEGPGAWAWRSAGHQHRFRNTGNQPVELVEIDWK